MKKNRTELQEVKTTTTKKKHRSFKRMDYLKIRLDIPEGKASELGERYKQNTEKNIKEI